MTRLTVERRRWRRQYERGIKPDSPWLQDYIKNRDSDLWRSTRALERLCEYILYLEDKLREK